MKKMSVILCVFLASCVHQNNDQTKVMQNRLDSLQTILAESYRPDFGDFMLDIQVHHSKLWVAGNNQNWPLAGYEVQKIKMTINNLVKYQSQRKEIPILGMLDRAVDSVQIAVNKKDPAKFKTTFDYVTNTCNICHRSYHYDFNVIKTPDSTPFTNQVFKPSE
jgi:hypothetical protein